MKKKQVALLLAALMCITPVAESAAVMGAEFSSGEETVEMQGTEEEAEAEDTAEIWTSGEEVSDFDTDEAPEVDGVIFVESKTPLKQGSFIDVRLMRTELYDMVARPATEI